MLAIEREEQAIQEAARLLEGYLKAEPGSAQVRLQSHGGPLLNHEADALLHLAGLDFLVEHKSQSFARSIQQAAQQLMSAAAGANNRYHPLLIVPHMGDVGKSICEEAGLNWLDLSGNASIAIHNPERVVVIHIEGKPNKFKRKGRPKDLFSPAASRIVRWFLMNQEKLWHQHMIAEAVSASEGYASKVVNRLIRQGEVARDQQGRLRLVDPAALLQSWRESYDIHKHQVIRGFMFGRSGPESMRQLSEKLTAASFRHAMTGLAGAWLYDHFASFRTVSLYLGERPSEALLSEIGFREDDKAANVWLILPNDMGVFDGERKLEDIPVVHQLQVYLDLKSHAERADEAAEHLLAEHLNWRRGAGR